MNSEEDSVFARDTRATASMACFRRLEQHNRHLGRNRLRRVPAYPSKAGFRFGDGRLGDVRHAAYVPAGIPGSKDRFTAYVPDADIPA